MCARGGERGYVLREAVVWASQPPVQVGDPVVGLVVQVPLISFSYKSALESKCHSTFKKPDG